MRKINTLYNKAYEYCVTAETTNNIPKYVKKQCKILKSIMDNENDTYFVSDNICNKINKLLSLLVMPTGLKAGTPIIDSLLPYQCLFFVGSFCIVYRDEPTKRKHERVILEITRKQGKSFLVALTFVIQLLLAPMFSRLYSVAPDGALSREVKIALEQIIKSCKYLNGDYKGKSKFKINRDEIKCQLTNNTYYPLNYSNSRLDGKMPSVYVVDEVGALPNSYALTAMASGQATVKNKLGFVISTKYPKIDNPFESEITYCKEVLDGVVTDDKVLSFLYEPDNIKDWETDDLILKQTNPTSLEIPEMWDDLLYKRERAINIPSERGNFLCKHCNIMSSEGNSDLFVDVSYVKNCVTKEPIDWNGRDVYVGADLSQSGDNSCISMLSRDEYGHLICKPFCFIPANKVNLKTKEEKCDYPEYIKNGLCYAVGEDVINYGEIEKLILSLEDTYGVHVQAFGYDRYNCISTVNKLEEAGMYCVEVKQHSSVLHAPTKLLYEEIMNGNFKFDYNPLFEINFMNCMCDYDTNLNRYIHKKHSKGKIDMVVATLNALCLLQQNELYDDSWVCS